MLANLKLKFLDLDLVVIAQLFRKVKFKNNSVEQIEKYLFFSIKT
jgi:hypothetical protein